MSAPGDPNRNPDSPTHPTETTPLIRRSEAERNDDLKAFQTILGIITPDDLRSDHTRPYRNEGLYSEIKTTQKWRQVAYLSCAWLINFCILAQIILAATLTALGASASSHHIITAIGAINTAFAGVLAILKGQGLPERLRKDWQALRGQIVCEIN